MVQTVALQIARFRFDEENKGKANDAACLLKDKDKTTPFPQKRK